MFLIYEVGENICHFSDERLKKGTPVWWNNGSTRTTLNDDIK